MEEKMVKDELGLSMVKRQNLGKAMEEVKSHASNILTLTLQWTDVEEHLSLVETSLEKRSKEIEFKEIELLNKSLALEERVKVVEAAEAKLDDLMKEIEEKGKEVGFLKKQIESCLGESKVEEIRLTQVKKSVEECMAEQKLKARQVTEMEECLRKTQGELSVEKEHLCRTQTCRKELEGEIERKTKDLTLIGERIVESGKKLKLVEDRLDVQQKLIVTRFSELISKKNELDSLQESIKISNCDIELSEQKIQSLNSLMMETSQQIESKAKELEIIQKLVEEQTCELNAKLSHYDSIKLLIQEHGEELVSREKKYDEMLKAIRKLEFEIECKEKTLERAESFIQQLSRKQHASENKLLLTERDLETTTAELESKKKELQAMEDEQEVRLRASLKERKQELIRKEKQLDIRSKKIEVKEKELDAQQEKIDHRDHKLKSTEQKSPKCVKDSGVKAKISSSVCQQSKPGQHSNLLENANLGNEKSLQLLLRGHLKKCPELHVDILSALKASSDPAKLVLDTIQGLYTAHQRMAKTKLDQNDFRWSSICLLECLMGLPPKPKPEVEGEAIKFATEWKNTTLVKAENPVEVLGFLHFLAAFSLAYTFDAEKVHNLFDLSFLRKYAPSLCKALGVSALAPVNNVLSSDDELEQLPSQAPITNRSASRSPGVQEMAGLSQLDCEDGLMDNEIPTSLSHNEVLTGLQLLPDPARFVLNLVEEALLGSNHQGKLGLAECTVKNVVIVLEELTRIPRSIDSRLHLDASKLASQWNKSMRTGTRGRVSSLEVLAFLQFIVAYRLMDRINREETVKLAVSVTRFKQAPKLFDSLGLSNAIPNLVMQLMHSRQYIPAIRFMFSFNLQTGLSPLNLLNEEINGLRRSAMETRRFNPQGEDKDAGKLRDIIELIADFKLEIDLPGVLIARFVLSQESLNQNQCFTSSVSLQPQERTPEVQMQVAHMATYGPSTSQATNFGTPSSNPHILGVETYQARGSSAFQGPSPQQQAGFKRPRVEPCVLRPCFEPPRTASLLRSTSSSSEEKIEESGVNHQADNKSTEEYPLEETELDLLNALKSTSDPAKLFLDKSMALCPTNPEGSYEFKLLITSYSCSTLLDDLKDLSPQIGESVQTDAKKLAVYWKDKVSKNKSDDLEVVCFLNFLGIFGIVSEFQANDLLSLLNNDYWRITSPDLCQFLGLTNAIPGHSLFSIMFLRDLLDTKPEMLSIGFIQNLIRTGHRLRAIDYIHSLDVVHSFQPIYSIINDFLRITKEYAEKMFRNAKNEPLSQVAAIDRQIKSLRSAIRCISNHKLESDFQLSNLEDQITSLLKERSKLKTPCNRSGSNPETKQLNLEEVVPVNNNPPLETSRDSVSDSVSKPESKKEKKRGQKRRFSGNRHRPVSLQHIPHTYVASYPRNHHPVRSYSLSQRLTWPQDHSYHNQRKQSEVGQSYYQYHQPLDPFHMNNF